MFVLVIGISFFARGVRGLVMGMSLRAAALLALMHFPSATEQETRWRQLMDEHGAYWFHPRTGKSTRTPPEELQGWQQFWSEKESKFYYVRHADGTTQWDPPAPFAWERYASEPLPSEPKSAANARDEL